MKMTIGKKIMLFGTLPSIATIFFIYVVIAEKIAVKAETDRVNALSQYIVSASGLVHELQKERGASAVYIASGGSKMKDVLEDNKRNTDKAFAAFQQLLESFHIKRHGSEFSAKVNTALGRLNELSAKRSAVIALSMAKDEAIGYYTSINTSFIQSFEHVALLANLPQISAPVSAYVNFISAKELAGIERATMGGIVGTNKAVSTSDLSSWMTAWKGHERLLDTFEYLASQEVISFYRSKLAGEVTEKVSNIRHLLLEKIGEGNFGITGGEVYEAVTQRINALKTIEDFQAGEVQTLSKMISTKAMRGIIVYAIITVVSVAAVVILNMFNMKLATKITTVFKNLLTELTGGAVHVASASEQISTGCPRMQHTVFVSI